MEGGSLDLKLMSFHLQFISLPGQYWLGHRGQWAPYRRWYRNMTAGGALTGPWKQVVAHFPHFSKRNSNLRNHCCHLGLRSRWLLGRRERPSPRSQARFPASPSFSFFPPSLSLLWSLASASFIFSSFDILSFRPSLSSIIIKRYHKYELFFA